MIGSAALLALAALGVAAAARRPPVNPPLPTGWRRMRQSEVTPGCTDFAREALKHAGAVGNLQAGDVDGKKVLAVTEWHYHDPEGPIRPHGWHHGISLLVLAEA
jgi:hypothetical protein